MDMQDEQSEEEVPPGLKAVPARRLAPAAQGLLLAIFGGALAVLLFVLPALVVHASPGEGEPAAAPADTAFKPTDDQWKGLQVKRVETRIFAAMAETDGKIAVDDDLTTPVFSPYSGRVVKVLAHAGDSVTAGTPLFMIQASELAQAQNDLISSAATLRTAHAQLELAKASEQRLHTLYIGHGAALKDWQQSRVDLATAQGGLSTAEIALAAVHNRLRILGETDEQIRALQNAGDPLLQTASATVRAPIAGTIIQRQVSPGQNIVGAAASAGAAQPVFAIGDLSRVWLLAEVPETDAGAIRLGDPVQVDVLAIPGRAFTAQITFVAATIDPNTHRLAVRAELNNADRALKPEMFANFRIVTGAGEAAPAVPEEAVVFDGAQAHVWLADPARKTLALRPITIGRTDRGMIEATSGLHAGDSIITSGSVFIDRTIAGS
jgi:cobalt-zinc-cadmium efflux system membrane fusion protein